MQNRQEGRGLRIGWAVSLLAAALVAGSPGTALQAAAQSSGTKSTPDLSGVWIQKRGKLSRRFRAEDAPLQGDWLKMYQDNRNGAIDPNRNGDDGLDPTMYCLQAGVPRIYTSPFPIEIVQTPGRIYMLFQAQSSPSPRYIYTDGRGHSEGYPSTVLGHSIGKWDGDTLVVDTVNIDSYSWIDGVGTPHSDALHVVERLRRVAHDTLEADLRFEDPKAFTEPWGGKKVFGLNPDWEYLPGMTCDDRSRADFEKKTLRGKKDWVEYGK